MTELRVAILKGMLGKHYPGQQCALARSLEVVGERWTLLILRDAFYGVRRFSDFATHLEIPRAVLSDRLRGLVDDGLLERRRDASHAAPNVYELTDHGRALWPALFALMRWGQGLDGAPQPSRRFLHPACDSPLDDRGICSRCGVAPKPQDILTVVPDGPSHRSDPVHQALQPARHLLDPLVI